MKVVVNGVEIESASVDDVLTMVRALRGEETKTRRKKSRVMWTSGELNFVRRNIQRPLDYIKTNFPNKERKMRSIASKYYVIKKAEMGEKIY